MNAVHKAGGVFFCQLWHVGRASHSGARMRPSNVLQALGRPPEANIHTLLPQTTSRGAPSLWGRQQWPSQLSSTACALMAA